MKARPVACSDLQSTRPDVVDVNTEYTLRLSPEQMAKLRSELDIVAENMTILNEMLTEMVPGREHPSDLELLVVSHHYRHVLYGKILSRASLPTWRGRIKFFVGRNASSWYIITI